MHQRLLGVLRGDAAETLRRDFLFDFIAHFGIGLEPPRVEQGNLVVLRNDFVRDDEFGEGLDVAVFGIHLHAEFAGGADGLLGRLQQRLFDGSHENFTADAFFALPKFQSGNKICIHTLINGSHRGDIRRTKKPERLLSPTFARWAASN